MEATGADVMRASAVVTVARNKLVLVMTSPAVRIPSSLRRDLHDVQSTMDIMAMLLRDAERTSIKRIWLRRVQDAAYRIWDMIDEFGATTERPVQMARMLPSFAITPKVTLARKTREVNQKLKLLNTRRRVPYAWSTRSLDTVGSQESKPFHAETAIVIREEEQKRIIDFLASSSSVIKQQGEESRPVIFAIFGFAGVGKTTLANLIFNHSRFQAYSKAWVDVSKGLFNLIEIGNSIISQVSDAKYSQAPKDMGSVMKDLSGLVHGSNNKKPYLIVLDDLWEDNAPAGVERLDQLKSMLSMGLKSNEVIVIVTTRSQDMAKKICTTIEPYKLQPLSDDLCWEIIKQTSRFEKWLRHTQEEEELEKIGRQVSRMCGGLPLVARAIGSVTPQKWSEVLSNQSDTPVLRSSMLSSLRLSYLRMPVNLRLCFVYCSIFPKGHTIFKDDLIHQWIAMHLIHPFERFSMRHKLGEEYIRKLLEISFLELIRLPYSTSEKHDNASAVSFRMHDAVHDLAISEMGDLLAVLDGRNMQYPQEKQCRHALLTNFDVTTSELSSILPAQVRALHLLGCSKMELTDGSFSFATYLGALALREPSMQKLPDSICQLKLLGYLNLSGCSSLESLQESFGSLINLVHFDLSGCSGLVKLPESFGNLINMRYIDLSGCSGLVKLPESFGGLISLVHISLSGCSGLEKLSESFGQLVNLVHIDLSGCSGLVKIPESFGKVRNVEYLDLSSCSLVGVIPSALGGLWKLQHLNLSKPCFHQVEHRLHLIELKNVWSKLKELRHLNLSMFFNPMFYHLPEDGILEHIESISDLSNLEHLDLSHNIFLFDLPERLCDLSKLCTLDLSGCIRLKRIARRIGQMNCLNSIVVRNCQDLEIFHFVVHVDDGEYSSNLDQLEDVIFCKELEISCLEKVKSVEEAKRIRLVEKQNLERLRLCWTVGYHASVDDEALLSELVPPSTLQSFELHGHSGRSLPYWLGKAMPSYLPNLVEVTMEDIPRCTNLPPLGLLPDLQRLTLRRMTSIRSINTKDLSNGNKAAFRRLSQLTLDDMQSLEIFNTEYHSGGDECMFPTIDALVIRKCRRFSFQSHAHALRAKMVLVSDCKDSVNGHAMEVFSSPTSTASAPLTELMVEAVRLAELNWSLLHQLAPLDSLHVRNCEDLTTTQEIMTLVTSLKSLRLSHCNSMVSLPYWLGDKRISAHLPNVVEVVMEDIPRCSELPPLGLLPELRQLVIRRMANITRINAFDLSRGYRAVFRRLSQFILDDMENLEEFKTTYLSGDGGMSDLFPPAIVMVIQKCRKLRFQPCTPKANMLLISDCSQLMSSSMNRAGGKYRDMEEGTSSPNSTASTPLTELVLEDVCLAELKWSLLHHLPPLYSLHMKNCVDLTTVPELDMKHRIMPLISSIKSLFLSQTDSISKLLPTWLGESISSHLPNLVEVTMQDIPWCKGLPPLGLLPELQRLVLRRMAGIEEIKAADLSGGSGAAFRRLLHFTMDDMAGLQKFDTSGDEVFMLPNIDELVIQKCHKLVFQPFRPRAKMLLISDCSNLMSSLMNRGDGSGVEVGHSSSGLLVETVHLSKLNWSLLDGFPPLHSLQICNCKDLTVFPEIMPLLSSITSLRISYCDRLTSLPNWMGENISSCLPNLEEVTMEDIPKCSDLPVLVLLPNLQRLVLRRMPCITRILDRDLSGDRESAFHLPKKNRESVFHKLSHFTMDDMENLQEFNTRYSSDAEEYLFPAMNEMVIHRCRKLRFKASCARTRMLVISDCNNLMSLLMNRGEYGVYDGPSSSTSSTYAPVTELLFEDVSLDNVNWNLLHGLPPLKSLYIKSCNDLSISEDNVKHYVCSLKSFYLFDCKSLKSLPEWLGKNPSSEKKSFPTIDEMVIQRCNNLRFQPYRPRTKMLLVSDCKNLMPLWMNRGRRHGVKEDPSSSTSTASDPVTELVLEDVSLSELNLTFLHGLPPPNSLHINNCNDLLLSIENIKLLSSIKSLFLSHCNGIKTLPNWLGQCISSYIPNLVEVTMEDMQECSDLPLLGKLPDLQWLVLRRMAGITRFNACDLIGVQREGFCRLSQIILEDMKSLEEFNTTCGSKSERFVFPIIDELVIQRCFKLRFTPCRPRVKMLLISSCDKLMSSWMDIEGEGFGVDEGPSSTSTTWAPITILVVDDVPLDQLNWSLLQNLPPPQSLHIRNCNHLTTPEETVPKERVPKETVSKVLASVECLGFFQCSKLEVVSEWLGHVIALRELIFARCHDLKSLPDNIKKLTNLSCLRIRECPELKNWCEKNEKVASLIPKYEE